MEIELCGRDKFSKYLLHPKVFLEFYIYSISPYARAVHNGFISPHSQLTLILNYIVLFIFEFHSLHARCCSSPSIFRIPTVVDVVVATHSVNKIVLVTCN